jgi:putative PIG3 family NAD(P)H quinone oxidoreductase
MRAISVRSPGGPEQLTLVQLPLPVPQADEVLLRVTAAGVNRPDLLQREGMYPPPAGASPILGLEVSGEIVAVGAKVSAERLGERVCALLPGGGYAEYCVAHVGLCLPIPAKVSEQDAAGLPETAFTVWSNVFEIGKLRAGERLLVHGGSSGIGVMAIQLAKALGAQVLVTAGTQAKCDFCVELGADLAIPYRQQDFVTEVQAFTGGSGVDVILDMVGGDYIAKNVESLAQGGRLVQIAFLQGPQAEVNFVPFLMKGVTMTGSTLRPRPVAEKARLAREVQRHVGPLLAAQKVRPITHQTFPLAEAAEAHIMMKRSAHLGKLLLTF